MMDVLEFCDIINKLKHLKRTGWVKRGISEPETVACHMYRMAMLAWVIRDSSINIDRCIKMALVHDLGESIIGDITPHCGIHNATKYVMEEEAMQKIMKLVPPSVGNEFMELWLEYETCNTPEAKLVKDLDRFDMIVQAFEYEKSTNKPGFLQEFFDSTSGTFQHSTVLSWVEDLNKVRNNHKHDSTPKPVSLKI